jgi:arylsulfatase A-like enzyme
VTTLAESLKARGYATVGFSATPNNSASHNLDQGFEVFRELWGRDNPDHGPFNMSRLAADVIANQPEDVPLFLQLHYLPPHQPYDPGPEFNQFTDPDYSGPIRPDMSLKPFSLGQQQLGPTDLNHLIGLYDGNLSVADAAVGQVLDALKSAGRFENSLIVITSNHGEAFMEHGRQGHNTTLFDGMLHVPLMIRLPGGVIPESFESDRLASTLDIVPTILGFVGGEVDPRVGGLDLLQTRTDPLRPRILFFRTSHPKNAMLAARTSTWKAISWPRHQVQMLFHLDQDPGETVNLVGEWPLVYAALGLRTRRHLQIGTDLQLGGLGVCGHPNQGRPSREGREIVGTPRQMRGDEHPMIFESHPCGEKSIPAFGSWKGTF